MKGGTKLSNVMARTLSPGRTAAQDRHMLDTAKTSDGDNALLSPAGTDQAHASTMDEWLEIGDPETLTTHSGGSDGQSGGKRSRRRRRRRTGGKKHSCKSKSKGKKTHRKSKKRRSGKRRTQRR